MTPRRFAIILIGLGLAEFLGSALLYLLKTTPPISLQLPISGTLLESYGSFVGGIVGTVFALAGVLLLIETLNEQGNGLKKQQVEARFFELLRIARDNSREVSIGNRSGRKLFIPLIRELNETYLAARSACNATGITDDEVVNIAYLTFFFGARSPALRAALKRRLKERFTKEFSRALSIALRRRQKLRGSQFPYKVFCGHQSRLGHYYRHLFQTVTYIDGQPANVLTYREKYGYIKTLRAQLSTQEQVLFLWNSLSTLGAVWERDSQIRDANRRLITKYNLIKNIPAGYSRPLDARHYYPQVAYEGLPTPGDRLELEALYQ